MVADRARNRRPGSAARRRCCPPRRMIRTRRTGSESATPHCRRDRPRRHRPCRRTGCRRTAPCPIVSADLASISRPRSAAYSFDISRSTGTSANAGSASSLIAVVIGDLLGLHQQVHVIGSEEILAVQFMRLDQVEHLEHGKALRRRRRVEDRDVAIAADERLAPDRLLPVEIGEPEQAAVALRRSAPSRRPPAPRRSPAIRHPRSIASVRARFAIGELRCRAAAARRREETALRPRDPATDRRASSR